MNSKQIMARALEDAFDLNERGETTNHEAVVDAQLSALKEAGFVVVPADPAGVGDIYTEWDILRGSISRMLTSTLENFSGAAVQVQLCCDAMDAAVKSLSMIAAQEEDDD